MKIVFVSNYYNHHQAELCEALSQLTEKFYFISTGQMRQERRELGYGTDPEPGYVLRAYESAEQWELAEKYIEEADAVIAGSAPEAMLQKRIRMGKLLLRYSERPLKHGFSVIKYLPRLVLWHCRTPFWKPVYMLCASAYTASDYRLFGMYHRRCYQWGYFPKTRIYDCADELLGAKEPGSILWAGRLIDWKHPEYAVLTAKKLKEEGYSFCLRIIGTGAMGSRLREMIADLKLENCVQLLGPMKPEQVREYMEKSEIFLFTSDKQEGWGAVLNEAMNSGCAVVASHAIGSVPFLIKNQETGLVYRSGDTDMLREKVRYLLEHPREREAMGKQAYETVAEEWNARTAAERLCELVSHLLAGKKHPELYDSGPISRAQIITDDWM